MLSKGRRCPRRKAPAGGCAREPSLRALPTRARGFRALPGKHQGLLWERHQTSTPMHTRAPRAPVPGRAQGVAARTSRTVWGKAAEGQAGIPAAPRAGLLGRHPEPRRPRRPHLHSLEEMKGTAKAPVLRLDGKTRLAVFISLRLRYFVCVPGSRGRFITALVRRGYARGMQGTQPSFKVGYLGVTPGKCSPGVLDSARVEGGWGWSLAIRGDPRGSKETPRSREGRGAEANVRGSKPRDCTRTPSCTWLVAAGPWPLSSTAGNRAGACGGCCAELDVRGAPASF